MSPAAADVSHPVSTSQPFSQNPNPSFPGSNGPCQQQSRCFNFDDKDSGNCDLSFDFSKKGSDLSGQQKPPRIRVPVKKKRGKLTSSENKDFGNALRPDSSSRANEASVSKTSSCDYVFNAGAESGKIGKMRFVFGANCPNVCSSGSNLKNLDEGVVFGANKTPLPSILSSGNAGSVVGANECSSSSGLSGGNGDSLFGANKRSSISNFDNGNGSFEFGASNDRPDQENRGVMFGGERSSLPPNLNMFEADKISSIAKTYNGSVGSAFGSTESGSTLKSSLGNGNALFGASGSNSAVNMSLGKGNAEFVDISSDLKLNSRSGQGNAVFGANTSESTFSSSGGSGSFFFGASKSNLSSTPNLDQREFSRTAGQSEADESKILDNGSVVFGVEQGELASDSGVKQKSSSNTSSTQSAAIDFGKFSNTGFVFGTDWKVGGKEDRPRFEPGAKQNASKSNAEADKSKVRRRTRKLDFVTLSNKIRDMGNEFQKADVNGVFLFGNSSKEKPSSSGSNSNSHETNRLDGESAESGNASMKFPSDAIMSNFKFVIGSSSSPGSAVYKIPLSKLFDEMKGLNIDNTKGISGTDKVKVVGGNSSFTTGNLFVFQSKGQTSNQTSDSTGKVCNGNIPPQDQTAYDSDLKKTSFSSPNSSSATIHVQQNGFGFEAPPAPKIENKANLGATTTPVGPDACSREFKWNTNESYSFGTNLFSGLGKKLEFSAKSRCLRDKRSKKTRGKSRQPILAKHLTEQDRMSKESSSPNNFESPGCYSPMDSSPYQDTTANARGSSHTSTGTENREENVSGARQGFDINEVDKKSGKQDNVSSKVYCDDKSSATSSAQDGLSAIKRQYRKKYKLKVGDGLNRKTTVQKSDSFSSSVQFSPNASNSSCMGKAQVQSGVAAKPHNKPDGQCAKQDSTEGVMHEECEQWRMRGNQAYKSRDLYKAEEYYTKGINSIKHKNASGFIIEPLLLCYSNRAATRMSLGRMREALEDCKSAAALDPGFLKVKLRAANCHLLLGEFQEAMLYYNSCLESGNDVCLDRRIIIEAADGLQKAQKVYDYMCQAAELLQQRTSDAANSVLTKVGEGLSISCYSEKLLEIKGEALFLLRRYDEVIELCEQTLHTAEKNFSAIELANDDDAQRTNCVSLWRWCLMSKSQFHLGRLEMALDLIEKQEKLTSTSYRPASVNCGSSIPLAAAIRELLQRKKAGNGAFQSGKHAEAVEHYTAAISSSVVSRPFAAICFGNRAAAHQALGLISDAIADCSLAIALDENYLKAVSRRATLHEMIRDYKQAITDLQSLISLLENQSQVKAQSSGKQDGSNESNRKELKQARQRLSLIEDMAKKGTPMDFYLILGIKASDSESDIKKAYRKAALKHHPDKAGQYLVRSDAGDDGAGSLKDIVEKVHEDADRLFKIIGEAYAVLSDPNKRSNYDYEEEIRNSCGSPSDFYSSPYDRGQWSGRNSNFSSSFERSRSGRSWHGTWRSYDNSHSRW
ncbi:unnamed protein product [Coffea canephora]|uniref:J domain-containing protein n=1 Tax=Coffea canephora TaxID=49390 RepID=A0A068V2U4_COFCA|nr:unnamed protein product [Coffea canephora]